MTKSNALAETIPSTTLALSPSAQTEIITAALRDAFLKTVRFHSGVTVNGMKYHITSESITLACLEIAVAAHDNIHATIYESLHRGIIDDPNDAVCSVCGEQICADVAA